LTKYRYFVVHSLHGGLAMQRIMLEDRDRFMRQFPDALVSEHTRRRDAYDMLLRLNRAGWQLASYEREQLRIGATTHGRG
jgi:hypothetical protein